MFRPLSKVKPYSARLVLAWVTKFEYPLLLQPFFSLFFPLPFQRRYLIRAAELPSLCNVVSSICQFFVRHFAMAVFLCIYLHYYTKQRDTSFEFSSMLSTVDLSKHLITA